MKIFITSVIISAFAFSLSYAEEKCSGALAKLKPSCNAIGSGIKKMKDFSSKNRTIGQSLGMEPSKKDKNLKSLKEFSSEHSTIDKTIKKIIDKTKK
jgi:hypothetical protein